MEYSILTPQRCGHEWRLTFLDWGHNEIMLDSSTSMHYHPSKFRSACINRTLPLSLQVSDSTVPPGTAVSEVFSGL